jgi:hypothetical protein
MCSLFGPVPIYLTCKRITVRKTDAKVGCEQISYRHADKTLDKLHIFPRLDRKIIPVARPIHALFPSRKRLILNLDAGQDPPVRRETLQFLSLVGVADGDLDLVEVVEDIEFGQVQRRVAVDLVGVLDDDEIEPAAAAAAAGGYAEFAADFLEFCAVLV